MKNDKIINYITSNLKYIRTEKGLSQNKFGELLHVDQTTIARWEDENRKPTIDKAIEISTILNIPLDVLTGIDFYSTNYDINSSVDLKLQESIKELSNSKKEVLINVADSMKNNKE